jgi:hypothetical protein
LMAEPKTSSERRAHRQRRPGHAGVESRPGPDPALDLGDRRGAPHRRECNSSPSTHAIRMSASSCHRVLRLAPGRDQEEDGRTERSGSDVWTCRTCRSTRTSAGLRAIIRSTPSRARRRRALMKTEHHLDLPPRLQIDFARRCRRHRCPRR